MQTAVINFLRKRKKDLSEVQLLDKKYAVWAGYLLVFIFLAMSLVLAVDFFLTTRTATLEKKQSEVEQKISTFATVEREYIQLSKKIEVIADLFENRDEQKDAIAFFTRLFSQEEATLKELQIDQDGTLRFQVVSQNVFVMKQTIQRLQQDDIRQQFQSLVMTDVVRNQSGEYSIEVAVVIGKKG